METANPTIVSANGYDMVWDAVWVSTDCCVSISTVPNNVLQYMTKHSRRAKSYYYNGLPRIDEGVSHVTA
jgi:hypothetical protein